MRTSISKMFWGSALRPPNPWSISKMLWRSGSAPDQNTHTIMFMGGTPPPNRIFGSENRHSITFLRPPLTSHVPSTLGHPTFASYRRPWSKLSAREADKTMSVALTATCRTLIRYNTARSAFSALVGLLIMTRHPYHINWTIRYRVGHFIVHLKWPPVAPLWIANYNILTFIANFNIRKYLRIFYSRRQPCINTADQSNVAIFSVRCMQLDASLHRIELRSILCKKLLVGAYKKHHWPSSRIWHKLTLRKLV